MKMASMKVAILLTMMVAMTLAVPIYEEHKEIEHHAHPKYEFKYGVKDEHTHDIKEQHEKRDGDKVEGYYKLVEPDGTTRTVHYTSDKHTGFHAQVVRSGHAIHPTYHHEVKKVIIPVKKIELPKYEEISLPSYSQESSGGASSYTSFKF